MLKNLNVLPEDFKRILRELGQQPGFIGFIDALFYNDDKVTGTGYCVYESYDNVISRETQRLSANAFMYMLYRDGIDAMGNGGIEVCDCWDPYDLMFYEFDGKQWWRKLSV